MPLDFPSSPSNGQVYDQWQWDGSKWVAIVGALPAGPTGPIGPAGPGVAAGGTTGQALTKINATDFNTQWTGPYLTGNQNITLSGDVSGSGTTAITTTLATVPVAKGGTGSTTAPNALTALGAYPAAGGTLSGDATVSHAGASKITVASTGAAAASLHLTNTGNPTGTDLLVNAAAGASLYVRDNALFEIGTNNLSRLTVGANGGLSVGGATDLGPGTGNFVGEVRSAFHTVNATAGQTLALNAAPGNNCTVGMTQTGAAHTWYLSADGVTPVFRILDNATNRLQISGDGSCYNTSGTWAPIASSITMKENVNDYTSGLTEICGLRPVTFSWRVSTFGPAINYGLIAEEVELVMPELVGNSPIDAGDGTVKTVDYGRIIFGVINALREISERLTAIEARLPPAVQGS